MRVSMHTHTYVCVYIYIYIHIHVYIYTQLYTYICVYACAIPYIDMDLIEQDHIVAFLFKILQAYVNIFTYIFTIISKG